MRRIIKSITVVILSSAALMGSYQAVADVTVKGHVRKDGTYVQPHTRSSPNSQKSDNLGTSSAQDRSFGNPSTNRDSDGDGISNRFDTDDDNDGTLDNNE